MAVKATIALAGIFHEPDIALMCSLASEHYRLLLLPGSGQLRSRILRTVPGAEVETIASAKEGCWEADIIVLAGKINAGPELINRIREVATQKIVVRISGRGNDELYSPGGVQDLQQLLPAAKVVQLYYDPASAEVFISGRDREALDIIAAIWGKAGYATVTG